MFTPPDNSALLAQAVSAAIAQVEADRAIEELYAEYDFDGGQRIYASVGVDSVTPVADGIFDVEFENTRPDKNYFPSVDFTANALRPITLWSITNKNENGFRITFYNSNVIPTEKVNPATINILLVDSKTVGNTIDLTPIPLTVTHPTGLPSTSSRSSVTLEWTPQSNGDVLSISKQSLATDNDNRRLAITLEANSPSDGIRARFRSDGAWNNFLGPSFDAGKDVAFTFSAGTTYEIRVEFFGTNIRVFVGDALAASWIDGRNQSTHFFTLTVDLADISNALVNPAIATDLVWNAKFPSAVKAWVDNPIVTGGQKGLPSNFLFWSVVDTQGRIADAPARYRVFTSTDHASGSSSGILAAWANSLDMSDLGTFQEVLTTTSGSGQLETPRAFWDGSQFILFAHLGSYPSGGNQTTMSYISNDLVNFTDEQPALDISNAPIGSGFKHTGYATPYLMPNGKLRMLALTQNFTADIDKLAAEAQWVWESTTNFRTFQPVSPIEFNESIPYKRSSIPGIGIFDYDGERFVASTDNYMDENWVIGERRPVIRRISDDLSTFSSRFLEVLGANEGWETPYMSTAGTYLDSATDTLYIYYFGADDAGVGQAAAGDTKLGLATLDLSQ